MEDTSAADIAAIGIAALALIVAIGAALFTRRQAVAAEKQIRLLTEPVFKFAERDELGDGKYREYLVIRNIGTARAHDVRVVFEADRAGRIWGAVRGIPLLEPNTEEELKTDRPLPHLSQMAEVTSKGRVVIERAEVAWTGVDGVRRTKRIPLIG